MNGILSQVLRLVMNRLLHRGVNAGIDRALGPKAARAPMTPAQKAENDRARATSQRAKQAMRLARKVGRF